MASAFGFDALRYDHARPRYPEAVIASILSRSPGFDVLDVGTGTGIAARQFHEVGCRVFGIDVDERMVAVARQSGIEADVAGFETWRPAGHMFDLVASGQAWHWIDPDIGARRAADVLRPGGLLAAFWNADELPEELAQTFADIFRELAPTTLAARRWDVVSTLPGFSALCRRAADGMSATGAFRQIEQWQYPWDRSYSSDEWLELLLTMADVAELPSPTLEALTTTMGTAIEAAGGSFTIRYTTVVVTGVADLPPA